MTEARTAFFTNLAGAHCLRDEFDKAKKCLYQVGLKDVAMFAEKSERLKLFIHVCVKTTVGHSTKLLGTG